jgi:hypothetical protein
VHNQSVRVDSVAMKREAAAITAIMSPSPKVSGDRVPGAVGVNPGTDGYIALITMNRVVIMSPMAGALLLLFFLSISALGYTNLGGNVYQSDGSLADTQAAVNAVPNNGTVQIPTGVFTWSGSLQIPNKAIHLLGKGAPQIVINVANADGVNVTASTAGYVEIGNLNFIEGSISANFRHLVGVSGVAGGQPVLLHDCQFTVNSTAEGCVTWQVNGGVIWNCIFFSNFLDCEGVQLKQSTTDTWRSPSTMGNADTSGTNNTYIEDCTFTGLYLQGLDFDDNSRTVVRHCTFNNSAITSHGQETSPWGTRHWEVYDNNFIFTPSGGPYPLNLNYWFLARGGTGVIFGNNLPHIEAQQLGSKAGILFADFNIQRHSAYVSCQTQYPSARQVGQTWVGGGKSYPGAPQDGSGYATDPVYIWGNADGNASDPGFDDYPDECGNNQQVANYIKSGRDYILGQAKPNYSAYTYPHPLRAAVNQGPPPPQNLRVVQ